MDDIQHIKPEDISEGEINAVIEMAEDEVKEDEEERYDHENTAYYMADVYSTLEGIDVMRFNETERKRIEKAKMQSLKLVCFCIGEIHEAYFPKNNK